MPTTKQSRFLWILAAVLTALLCWHILAFAQVPRCYTTTVYQGGRYVSCLTCCDGYGNCTVTCTE